MRAELTMQYLHLGLLLQIHITGSAYPLDHSSDDVLDAFQELAIQGLIEFEDEYGKWAKLTDDGTLTMQKVMADAKTSLDKNTPSLLKVYR